MHARQDSPVFVTRNAIEIPPDPGPAELFGKTDPRHWYQYEYAPWIVPRRTIDPSRFSALPLSERRVACLLPGAHPYFDSYTDRLRNDAAEAGIELIVRSAGWDPAQHFRDVEDTVRDGPDIVIYVADEIDLSTAATAKLAAADIPIIGSNMPLTTASMRNVVGWTGPDVWAQSRALARRFADTMGAVGTYAVIGHVPGTPVDLARTWGVVSELTRYVPKMHCCTIEHGVFEVNSMRRLVHRLIERFGRELKGICSADDNMIQRGVAQALHDLQRTDIKTVSHGSTTVGVEFLQQGKVEAITYQSARADGALAMQAAVDCLNGFEVDPARFLPVYVVDRSNVDDFVDRVDTVDRADIDSLESAILSGHQDEIEWFFRSFADGIRHAKVLAPDSIRGLALEILVRMCGIADARNIAVREYIGSYERAAKNLTRRRAPIDMVDWLERGAKTLAARLMQVPTGGFSIAERLARVVQERYDQPLSLKTLSDDLGVSAGYLGRAFHEQYGERFSVYLNRYRIERACVLLKRGTSSARDVGEQVGFADPNYFYLVFKRFAGMTVSQYIHRERS
jgi:ABC-type sugar transport system substrate-binding protein/AraC-like DNA-binding protein